MMTEHGHRALPDTRKLAADDIRRVPRKTRRRIAGAVAGVSMAAGVAAGAVGMRVYDDHAQAAAKDASQPACDVPAKTFGNEHGTVSGIVEDVAKHGDTDPGEVQVWVDMGTDHAFKRNGTNTRNYYVSDSRGLQAGDDIVMSHVDPAVCAQVGGTVLESMPVAASQANVQASQK